LPAGAITGYELWMITVYAASAESSVNTPFVVAFVLIRLADGTNRGHRRGCGWLLPDQRADEHRVRPGAGGHRHLV
jgi:hypothetical protein